MPLILELSADPSSPGVVGLRRGRSLLKRPSLPTPTPRNATSSSLAVVRPPKPPVRFPTEILEKIVDFYVLDARPPIIYGIPDTADSVKTFMAHIKPFMNISKGFRYLLMRSFMRVLVLGKDNTAYMLRTLSELDKEYSLQNGGFLWVKSLTCASYTVPPNSKILASLTRLQTMQIDFTNYGLRTQRQCLEQFFGSFSRHGATLKLTSLEFTHMPRIDIHLLTMIAKEVSTLRALRISSTDSLDMNCCPNCYEDSLSRIVHSPIPHLYQDVESFANAFGRALKSLKHLTSLALGTFLSPTHVLDLHIEHGVNELDIRPMTAESVYDCARCFKYLQGTRQRELLATLILAGYLESLESVEWSSLFLPPCKHNLVCHRCGIDTIRGQVDADEAGNITVKSIPDEADAAAEGGDDKANGKVMHDHDMCECRNDTLAATFSILRPSSTMIEVKRRAL